ncbi:MAG TPA: preprotein translocase subunit SecG [Feifaniaceae bacterium]|nr:preprotein translocase subunit SecG [Feifaniaceae bacterium]
MIITIILLIVSVVLIVVVLMQQAKTSGLGAAFGGEGSSLSVKGKAATKEAKLQKLTKILAIAMGVLSVLMVALPAA